MRIVIALTVLACSCRARTAPDAGLDADSGTDAGFDAGCIFPSARPGLVVTDRGAVAGTLSNGVTVYRGIPYAQPPVGPLRWRPPEEHACWAGERSADAFGPSCPQLDDDGGYDGAEDCLTLNVWPPRQLRARER